MSILNVLRTDDQLLVAVDTWAMEALSGQPSCGAKLLLIPHYNVVLASRGSAQFFIRMYETCLQASFRPDFSLEKLMTDLVPAIDALWPAYIQAVAKAGVPTASASSELVLGGWCPTTNRMVAAAYAKTSSNNVVLHRRLVGGLASPGEPLKSLPDSFELPEILTAGRLQAEFLNKREGRVVAGGRLIVARLSRGRATIEDAGAI